MLKLIFDMSIVPDSMPGDVERVLWYLLYETHSELEGNFL